MKGWYGPFLEGVWVTGALRESIRCQKIDEVLIIDMVGLFQTIMSTDDLTCFVVVWWWKVGRSASKKLSIAGLVTREWVFVEKCSGDVEIEGDEVQFVNSGMCLATHVFLTSTFLCDN